MMRSGVGKMLVVGACLLSYPSRSSAEDRPTALPWLAAIAPPTSRQKIHTIMTEANVTVSDGLTYVVKSLYHDPQRAVLRMIYPDREVTSGVEGRYLWTFDGQKESEGPSSLAEYVHGHQVHAQILFFDRLHANLGAVESGRFQGHERSMVQTQGPGSVHRFYFDESSRPLGMESALENGPTIVFAFDDWREVEGLSLPFAVRMDDGERQFQYRYSSIRLNEGTLARFRAPASLLTDEQQLLRRHRDIMDDHLFGRTAQMRAAAGDSAVTVSGGEVAVTSGADEAAALERMMSSREYTTYDDLIRPIVRISEDGTLGWVIVQVSAKGVRLDEAGQTAGPLDFTSAWIELYEKKNGMWKRIGNVSNFKPDRP